MNADPSLGDNREISLGYGLKPGGDSLRSSARPFRHLNLLILAFWRHHQALVDTWMPLAKRLEEQHQGFIAYELPVIQSRGRLSQWFIDSGMRAGIPDRRVRERTITLYLDKPQFLDDLEIADDGTIYSMLVDQSGDVLWRTTGPLDPTKESQLEEAATTAKLLASLRDEERVERRTIDP